MVLHAYYQLTVLFRFAYLLLYPRHVVGSVARASLAVLVIVEGEQSNAGRKLRDI